MGRAFPAYGNVPFEWDVSDPMAITDEKGNIGIMETIDNTWTERLARVQTVEMGASALSEHLSRDRQTITRLWYSQHRDIIRRNWQSDSRYLCR